MPMDRETRLRLVNLRDDTGVLSLYVNADPRQESSQPPWKTRLEKGVKHLLDSVEPSVHNLLERRLHELELEIEHLVRPGSPGIGRALFIPLSGGQTFAIEMQTPLTDRVALAPRSHIAPMFAAWAEGSPAGIAVVDGKGMRLLDSRFGQCEEISGLSFELDTDQWRVMKGPTANHSAWNGRDGYIASNQHDLFDYRIAEHLAKFLRAAHKAVEEHVATFGWEYLVVTGEPELVEAASKSLSNSIKTEVVPSQLILSQTTPAQIQEKIGPELTRARNRRDERLVADFAEAPPKAAMGPKPVLDALGEGRIARIMVERDSVWSGGAIPPGSVVADGIEPIGGDLATAIADARLGEEFIERTLSSGGVVSILSDDVRLPERAGGVGAFLRW